MSDRLVRPYLLTGGRTRPSGSEMPMETLVLAQTHVDRLPGRTREHREIVAACAEPRSIIEVATRLKLPLGVTRVLVGDLVADGALDITEPSADGPDVNLLERLLHGLQTL